MFDFINRSRTIPTPGVLRLRRIDIELAKLAARERTEVVQTAIDHWLDRRNALRVGTEGGSR